MKKSVVAIVRYEQPLESLRKVIDLCSGLDGLPPAGRVFIKPNIPFWTRFSPIPKWGVITTTRIVEDTVLLLREKGITDITIGEGMVVDPKDKATPAHAFETLGYNALRDRYGVRVINTHEHTFEKVDLGTGVMLRFNADILHSDFVINLPVLKTHAQTVVSLGIKNLKGMLDMNSRKKCHSADPEKDLHYMIARLPKALPPTLTIQDGIYTNERGPGFDGKLRRSNILIASRDLLAAEIVGTRVLGHKPSEVAHLVHAARDQGRTLDLENVDVVGERIEDVASFHQYTFPYNEDESLPLPMEMAGIKGVSFYKFDSTICTYCVAFNSAILTAIGKAWKGEPWDEVEVLTGKVMQPDPKKKKTILLGKCMYQAHKENPLIQEMIPVKGCPPQAKDIIKAFHKAGIPIEAEIIESIDKSPASFMKRYEGKPGFEESFFQVA